MNEMPKTSFRIPHIAQYNQYTISGGGYTETRTTMNYEGNVNNISNDGWHNLSTGNNNPHNNMQPYVITNYIIKAFDVVSTSKPTSDFTSYNYETLVAQSGVDLLGSGITILKNGVYLFNLTATIETGSKVGDSELALLVNSDNYILENRTNVGEYQRFNNCKMLKLNVGDIVKHRVFQNGGYGEYISNRTLSMIMLTS